MLQAFPSLYIVFLILSQFFFQFPLLFLLFPVVIFFSFVGLHCVLPNFFYYMFPTIFAAFLYGFLYHISCIFNILFQEFYPSPSISDHFCTISSGCYGIFLHFHCIFPAYLLHRHNLFLAVARVSSMFQQILHGLCLLLAFSSDRYHIFLKFHCILQYILFVGFQYILSSIFLLHVSYYFHLFPP